MSEMQLEMKEVEFQIDVTVAKLKEEKYPPGDAISLKFVNLDRGGSRLGDLEATAVIEYDDQKKDDEKEYKYSQKKWGKGVGVIVAVIVELGSNNSERFVNTVSITNKTSDNTVNFGCNSWVQSKDRNPNHPRVFFYTKSCLPRETPSGLKKLRAEDLADLRGEHRQYPVTEPYKTHERIYDYDLYNDLGDPETDFDKWRRDVLGGKEYPYPRRCRTGRPPCDNDPNSEKRSKERFYVPRDEEFSEEKKKNFLPSDPKRKIVFEDDPVSDLPQIESSFRDPKSLQADISASKPSLPSSNTTPPAPIFPPPESYKRDKYGWLSDGEFARQTLAGVNPYSIQLVKSLPFMSELDHEKYGPPESLFTTKLVDTLIAGASITANEAIKQKKLFVLDYHDILMPFVKDVRKIPNTTLYGSRTLFFLKPDDTLMPLGIELTRPPIERKDEQWKQLFTPSTEGTDLWLWRLAKAHVLSHDSCIHQIIIHWLRSHCCMEPYAIATNRQLSTMHPIYRLLHPHFRYNLRINANARENLISAGGIIEGTFSTASLSMKVSSLVYEKEWRFDQQALPDDLIRRGMAKQKKDEHGNDVKDEDGHNVLELTIKDYPFANDGLILWNCLLKWVTKYVNYYYKKDEDVRNDEELDAWWREIKEKGHPDIYEGWPELRTADDLIKIVSTIAWVGCGHHSAVNFIQYAYAGYMPNRPSIARVKMPSEGSQDLPKTFLNRPESELFQIFPSTNQEHKVKVTMFILSKHSEDEEYIGDKIELAWTEDIEIEGYFQTFQHDLDQLNLQIDKNNEKENLKNRFGAGVMPYDVFKTKSDPGVTGQGIPYSVST